jgi:hypothetical protein
MSEETVWTLSLPPSTGQLSPEAEAALRQFKAAIEPALSAALKHLPVGTNLRLVRRTAHEHHPLHDLRYPIPD